MIRTVSLLAASGLALATIGCGGGGSFLPKNVFPTREKVAALAEAPVKPIPARAVATAPAWKVDPAGADAPTPVEQRFAQAAGGTITFTREMRCIAREAARFHLEHGAQPDERLERFIAGACGSTLPFVGFGAATGQMAPEMSDDEVIAQWAQKLEVPESYRNKHGGIWLARNGDRVVVATTIAKPEAVVTVTQADASGVVVVKGTAPAKTEAIIALVNQGQNVATCDPDLDVPLPLFSFRCTMAQGDRTAWIEVSARPEGRLLTSSVVRALARRDAGPLDYVAPARAAAGSTIDPAAVLEGVNRARANVRLPPVALAPAQSATNGRLAPHFFQASLDDDQEKSDVLGLGLIAGWDVEGMIRDGNLFAALLSGSGDAGAWLDYVLETPMGRHTVLTPRAAQVAVGVARRETVGGLGAVITTYEFFGEEDHKADAHRVLLRLQRARLSRGLSKPVPIEGLDRLAAQATLVRDNQKDALEALNDGLTAERDHSGRGVRGWVVATNDIETMPLPPELLATGQLAVGIEVTHYRPEGAPWGYYVVFFLVPSDAGSQTAKAPNRSSAF
ncbi:MAG: hypothetical protein KF819_25830 [Labilithrix sp.]|nr:hypothetical protein [Labilithrix sp.]